MISLKSKQFFVTNIEKVRIFGLGKEIITLSLSSRT